MGFWEDHDGSGKSWSTEDSSSAIFIFCKQSKMGLTLNIKKKNEVKQQIKRVYIPEVKLGGVIVSPPIFCLIDFPLLLRESLFFSEWKGQIDLFRFSSKISFLTS